ncbi:YceH family protein [Marinomonas ostreistagni]|uniref:YceH family protein n=1 Tax=Marinomonas ostreistagni TaxID=359209 RepID=UPI00194F7D27|nr:DUF480 domain-containing protein [Marinomonas ostreistagni]MBM6551182.1 DUF480 domain-containing protein [Marinomonas ostreistagni]
MSHHHLTAKEARIIGSLIEKSIVTPDHYPMTLNALSNACNQKSSRDPVVSYDDLDVQNSVDGLVARGLVTEVFHNGSRVPKYQHRFCNTEFSDLQFDAGQTAIVCLLLLRGPQTPGELRSRSGRLHAFASIQEVEQSLNALRDNIHGPFVEQLPREPGKREARYQELFCFENNEPSAAADNDAATVAPNTSAELEQRVATLEQLVQDLHQRLAALEGNAEL